MRGVSRWSFRRNPDASLAEQRRMAHVLLRADDTNWIGQRDLDLVIATGTVPKKLEQYVQRGGHLLTASSTATD